MRPEMQMVRVVIIGSGIAGVSCVEELFRLQALGYGGQDTTEGMCVTLVTSTSVVTRASVVEKVTRQLESLAIELSDARDFRQLYPALHVVVGVVQRVIPERNVIEMTDKRLVEYDRLCICVGARPELLVPNHPRVLAIRDTESVDVLREKLRHARRVVVAGNGGVAMELVEAVKTNEVVWLIKHSHIGNTFLDADAASFILPNASRIRLFSSKPSAVQTSPCIETSVRTHGRPRHATSASSAVGPDWMDHLQDLEAGPCAPLMIEFDTEVDAIWDFGAVRENALWTRNPGASARSPQIDDSWPLAVQTSTGKTFGCDLVVCAIGVIPNTELLRGSLPCDSMSGGIRVDEEMQVEGSKNLFAAGDCVSLDTSASCWLQMRLWSQARLMGRRAAQSMLSAEDEKGLEFDLFAHATHFFGFRVILLGLFNGQNISRMDSAVRISRTQVDDGSWLIDGDADQVDDETPLVLLRCRPGVDFVKVLVVRGRVQGATLIGETGLEDALENLLMNQLDIGHMAPYLLDPDVDIDDFFD